MLFSCLFFYFFGITHESDPEEEEDDTIHMGNAIMTFYAALIDLLGRCAPEMHVSPRGPRAALLAHLWVDTHSWKGPESTHNQ